MKQQELKQKISEWMRDNPKIKQANHTLVALFVAARGSIISEHDHELAYRFELENSEAPEINGNYKVTIEKLED